MNEILIFSIEIAKSNWDVLAVLVGFPLLAVLGLGIAELVNKGKGVFQ